MKRFPPARRFPSLLHRGRHDPRLGSARCRKHPAPTQALSLALSEVPGGEVGGGSRGPKIGMYDVSSLEEREILMT